MKVKVEVDIDWIEEDGNIDEEVKYQIIAGVKGAISKQCLDKVEKKASEQIDNAISQSIAAAREKIEQEAVNFTKEWLDKKVVVTDKWGDVKKKASITDLIKEAFDNLLEKKVDDRGRFTNSYGGGVRLINWLTGTRVQEIVEEKLKDLGKNIDKQIAEAVSDSIKKNVAEKFAEMVINGSKK